MRFGFYLNSFENSGGTITIRDTTKFNINNQIFILLTGENYDNFVSIDEANTIAKWAETAQIDDDFTTNDFTIWREE